MKKTKEKSIIINTEEESELSYSKIYQGVDIDELNDITYNSTYLYIFY